jgi:hypothetical protein
VKGSERQETKSMAESPHLLALLVQRLLFDWREVLLF